MLKRAENQEELTSLIAALRAGRPDFTAEVAGARAEFDELLRRAPVAEDLYFTNAELGGVCCVIGCYPCVEVTRGLLYLHGGAFIAGSADGYRSLSGEIARSAGLVSYAPEYRTAPEHPFPAAVEDCTKVYRAILSQDIASDQIVLAGDSAGGGLVISTLLALRDAGDPMPAAAVVISPWVDLVCESPSFSSNALHDPSLTPEGLRSCAVRYLAGEDPCTPLASPVYADLTGLPPLLVQVGSIEILLDDAVRLAANAGRAGVPVRLEIWSGMPHVWHSFSSILGPARRAIASAGAFMREALAP